MLHVCPLPWTPAAWRTAAQVEEARFCEEADGVVSKSETEVAEVSEPGVTPDGLPLFI